MEYRGRRKFDREQLIVVVESILVGALDGLDGLLPDDIAWKDVIRSRRGQLGVYERARLEGAGMALGCFYATLTNDGLGVHDALVCADNFFEVVEEFWNDVWKDKGVAVKKRLAKLKDRSFHRTELYPNWPDCHKHAVAFVDKVFDKGGGANDKYVNVKV